MDDDQQQEVGIPGLAEKLDHLFKTVINPAKGRRYSNDSAAMALHRANQTVTSTHISHLRTGRRNNPSARLLAGLAELFGVPLSYFFDRDVEARINSELRSLEALRDSEIHTVMLRSQGVSPQGMEYIKAFVEQVRRIEGLDDRDGDAG